MQMWAVWKRLYRKWDGSSTPWLGAWIDRPQVLEPAAAALSAIMRMRDISERAGAMWWGSLGLPTKRDQQRMFAELHRVHSRVMDLEDQLERRAEAGPS